MISLVQLVSRLFLATVSLGVSLLDILFVNYDESSIADVYNIVKNSVH